MKEHETECDVIKLISLPTFVFFFFFANKKLLMLFYLSHILQSSKDYRIFQLKIIFILRKNHNISSPCSIFNLPLY